MESKIDFLSNSPAETKKIALQVIRSFNNRHIFALVGDLGSGKTVFVKGVLENFGLKDIISPTFLIIKEYQIPKANIYNSEFSYSFEKVYHIDCYRVGSSKEILPLGIEEFLQNKNALIFIEWADRIVDILPPETVFIIFDWLGKNKRQIKLKKTTGL